MIDFFPIVLLIWSIGLLLSMSSYIYWSSMGKFMIATGAIGSISAYLVIILINNHISFIISIFISTLSGVIFSILFTYITQYTNHEEFILVTLVFVEIIRRVEFHFIDITKGAYGIRLDLDNMPTMLQNSEVLYLIIFALALIILIILNIWYKSNNGIKWRIAGNTYIGAENIGINTKKIQYLSSVLAGFLASLGGINYAVGIKYLHPNDLSIDIGLLALTSAISIINRFFLISFLTITILIFLTRELLRLINLGGASRFGFFECFVGLLIIFISIKMSKNRI